MRLAWPSSGFSCAFACESFPNIIFGCWWWFWWKLHCAAYFAIHALNSCEIGFNLIFNLAGRKSQLILHIHCDWIICWVQNFELRRYLVSTSESTIERVLFDFGSTYVTSHIQNFTFRFCLLWSTNIYSFPVQFGHEVQRKISFLMNFVSEFSSYFWSWHPFNFATLFACKTSRRDYF